MKVDHGQDTEAVARHLRLCIQARRLTMRWVEDQLGMGEGYLGQLLRGNLDLKVKHVMGVLRVIGMEPAEFFSTLYSGALSPLAPHQAPAGPPRLDPGGARGTRTLPKAGEVVPGLTAARLDRIVRESLQRLGFGEEFEEPARPERESPPRRESKKGR